MANKEDINTSLFVYARDAVTQRVQKMAVPFDMQVGTIDDPRSLQLLGGLTLRRRTFNVTDDAAVKMQRHDTITSIRVLTAPSLGYVSVQLPTQPQDGELHYIIDSSLTAATTSIIVTSTVGHLISGETSHTLSTPGSALALFWDADESEWTLLSVSSGTSGGGGGDSDASYVVLSATSSLANERVLTAGSGIALDDAGAGSAITIENTRPGDINPSYVVMALTASLPNERQLVVSGGLHVIDGGAGSTVTLVNTMPGDTFPQYLLLTNTASLPNERSIAAGTGIKFLDGGAHSDFTVFINDNVVATVSGTRFTGRVDAAGGLTGSLQRLSSGLTFLAGGNAILVTTASNGQVQISVKTTDVADVGAQYVTLEATASLPNERVLTAGTDISMSDAGAGGALTLYNNHGFDRGIPVVGMYLTGSLNQQRVLSAGNGIQITDFGAGNAVRIALEQFTSQSTHAFQGHCTGSLTFTSTNWADIDTVFLGSFVDDIQNHITRTGSTFTVVRDGIYNFSSNFNANVASGSHIAFRVSGSAGSLLQHTSWQPVGNGQPSTSLNGLLSLTSGSSIKLQYATSGSAFQWPTPGLVGGPVPDVESVRTGEITLFLVADPIVVSQSFVTNNNTVTGSGWITACDINFAASSSVTVVDGTGNSIGGISWRGTNITAGANSVANVPGDGFRIDPNSTNTDNGLTNNNAPQVSFPLSQIIPEWNLDDVEIRVWAQFNNSASALTAINAAQVELARSNWLSDNQNYSFRSRRYSDGASFLRNVSGLYGSTTVFAQTHAQDHNIIIMHWRNPRHCDFFSSVFNGGNTISNDIAWPHISSTFYRGQGDLASSGLAPTMLTGSNDLSFIWSAYTQNTANNFTASMQRLKVEYRRGVGTGGGGSGGSFSGSITGGGDPDAPYLVAQTTGSLTQQRLVVAGPGITISDGGPNGLFAISASSFTSDADIDATYIVMSATSSLPNERFLSMSVGLSMSDGGPGNAVTLINTRPGDVNPSYVVLALTSSLPNERQLTAGTNVTITDNGPGGTVVIAAPGTGADIDAQYVVLALTSSLPNERRLIAGTGISITDGGAGGNVTISTNASTTFADASASYVVMALTTSLPNERRLVAGTGISIVDAGADSTVTINNTIAQGADPQASYVVLSLTGSLSNERLLTAGAGITISDAGANNAVTISMTAPSADISASYIVINTTSSLANERALTAGHGLYFEDGGPNGTLTIHVNTASVAMTSASYVVLGFTGTLPNERVLTAGAGISILDNGPNGTVVVSTDGTGNGDRAAQYVVLALTSSLDNERVLTAGSGITITDNGPGSSVVISSTGGAGGSRFPDPEAFFIYSGIKTTVQTVWEAIGVVEFTPDGATTMAPSGSSAYQAYFAPILEVYPSGTVVAARLYNIGTAAEVTNSLLTGSSLYPQILKSANLSGSLITGENLYELQIKVSSSVSHPAYATCKGAKLNVVWL